LIFNTKTNPLLRNHIYDLNDNAVTSDMPERVELTRLFLLAVSALTRLVRAQALFYTCSDTFFL
jgi:hypothetical protein